MNMARLYGFTVCLIMQVLGCFSVNVMSVLECKCKINLTRSSADCSNLNLVNVSDIMKCLPKTLKELDLSNNSIQFLDQGVFKTLVQLETLRLGYNNIEHLSSGIFNGLAMLKHLALDHNRLSYNSSYADNVFAPVKHLRCLYLQGNCAFPSTNCSYPDKALSDLSSLQYLQLDGIPYFGPGFSRLESLLSLYFVGQNAYCNFNVLTENTFAPFRQTPVSNLHIDGCDIRILEPNVFHGLRNLTTLIITDNRRLCSDSIDNATIGLNETNIKTIRFTYWCRDRLAQMRLSDGMLKGLTNTTLKTLDLSWNLITYVDSTCIDNLPRSLKYLSFKENKIDDAIFLKRLKHLENLETFDLSYQYHNDIKKALWKNKGILKQNVSKDLISTISDTDDKIYLPKNIKTIYMNDIKLQYPVPPLTFGPNTLQYLDSSNCMLTAFLGPWYGLTNLNYFDLSSNRFRLFSSNSLIDMGNLTTLLLQNNQIGPSLQNDVNGQTFSSQKRLEVLNLSNNAIKGLPNCIFKNQVSLETLSLADNSLTSVSFSLTSMRRLKLLDLSGNQIAYISNENMDFLDRISQTQTVRMNFSGNILSCKCDNQKFMNWLATTKVNIIDRSKLLCLYRNNTDVSLSNIHIIRQQLEYECTLWIVMTACVVGFVVLLFLFAFIALLYHSRWQLRYLWYIGRNNIDPFHHPDDQHEQLLEIDAYISYEQHYDVTNDVNLHQFITERVYPYFKDEGYTVTIREEFEANDKLYQVIPKTIRKSRKVIVLLTPSYCKDDWNIFEFNIAAYEGIYTKRKIIIPVLVGDMFENQMTPEIRSFLRSKIKSKEFLRFPDQIHHEGHINKFNKELEQFLRI